MGTRSKGRYREAQVTTYAYKPRLRWTLGKKVGKISKLARRMLRSKRDTYATALAGEFAASARSRKPSRRARGKRKDEWKRP